MASDIQVCNLALSHISDRSEVTEIDPPDDTPQARRCAQFFPVARDIVLEEFWWPFATRRSNLVQTTNPLVNGEWAFAYLLPAEFLKVQRVQKPGASKDDDSEEYVLETGDSGSFVIYTNVEDAVLRYTFRETNIGRYSPLAVSALSWLLGAFLAGPTLKGKVGSAVQKGCMEAYAFILNRARASAGSQQKLDGQYATYQPKWVTDR